MKIFDGHLHTFRFKVPVRESIGLFQRQFERFGVEKMTFLALPCDTIPGRVEFKDTDELENLRVMYFKGVFSPNAYAYAGLEYKNLDIKDKKVVAQDLLRQVKLYKKVGYDGMKMYEGHPNFRKLSGYALDDEVFDLYYDFCEKEGFPILMHISQPPYFWDKEKQTPYFLERGWAFDETHPTFEQLHDEILRRLEKNPKLRLSLAHWGFLTFDKAKAEKFMSYPNTVLDVCPGGDNFLEIEKDKEYWIPFIEKYQDRITYGTDSYNFEYETEEQWLRATGARPGLVQNFFMNTNTYTMYGKEYKGIGISKEIQEKIFYDNLEKMMGKPSEMDYDYLVEKVEKLMTQFDENHFEYRNLWCMKHDFAEMKKGTFVYGR